MAVVTTYKYPVSGTTPPTLLQAGLSANMVTAVVSMGDADTIITITHNLNVTTADDTSFIPIVTINYNSDATTTLASPFLVAFTSTSVVTINKPTIVGTQGTFIVTVARPMSSYR